MMGGDGLTQATRIAILSANYVTTRLSGDYNVLYTGSKGRVRAKLVTASDCCAIVDAAQSPLPAVGIIGIAGPDCLNSFSLLRNAT